mmetsp:Transcript_58728/g.190151  ORF Transcript_58728/g.190151 Transcript_58728/m.190151 type:complete len:285 (+) Transcript_58728:255-1109(+)
MSATTSSKEGSKKRCQAAKLNLLKRITCINGSYCSGRIRTLAPDWSSMGYPCSLRASLQSESRSSSSKAVRKAPGFRENEISTTYGTSACKERLNRASLAFASTCHPSLCRCSMASDSRALLALCSIVFCKSSSSTCVCKSGPTSAAGPVLLDLAVAKPEESNKMRFSGLMAFAARSANFTPTRPDVGSWHRTLPMHPLIRLPSSLVSPTTLTVAPMAKEQCAPSAIESSASPSRRRSFKTSSASASRPRRTKWLPSAVDASGSTSRRPSFQTSKASAWLPCCM